MQNVLLHGYGDERVTGSRQIIGKANCGKVQWLHFIQRRFGWMSHFDDLMLIFA